MWVSKFLEVHCYFTYLIANWITLFIRRQEFTYPVQTAKPYLSIITYKSTICILQNIYPAINPLIFFFLCIINKWCWWPFWYKLPTFKSSSLTMVSWNWHPSSVLTVTIISNQSCFQEYQELTLTGPGKDGSHLRYQLSLHMEKEYQGMRCKDKKQVAFIIRTSKNDQMIEGTI